MCIFLRSQYVSAGATFKMRVGPTNGRSLGVYSSVIRAVTSSAYGESQGVFIHILDGGMLSKPSKPDSIQTKKSSFLHPFQSKLHKSIAQEPHSQILMMGGGRGGGVQQRFTFYTQKIYHFRICLPKKITTFFSIPKKIPYI